MDLFRSMQVFVTTVQSGSMSAAANQLNLSPAMVGQHIAALESRLQARLLNRTTRRQHLTDFGVSYLAQCKDILERVALTELAAETQHYEARGNLRMTAPITFGSSVLMPALKSYRDLSPLVSIDLVLSDSNLDLIEKGFDIAFRIGDIPDSRLIQRNLMPYEVIVCASPDYLDKFGTPSLPDDLASHQLITFTPSQRLSWTFYKKDVTSQVVLTSMVKVNNSHAILNAALAGLGIVIQPKVLLDADIKAGRLIQLLPDWELGKKPLSMIYYQDQHMTPRTRSFINFAIKEFVR